MAFMIVQPDGRVELLFADMDDLARMDCETNHIFAVTTDIPTVSF